MKQVRKIQAICLLLQVSIATIAAVCAQAPQKTTSPAKPTVARTNCLGLQEYSPSQWIAVDVSQSRLFKIGAYIARTSIADPSIADPVVLCENQFVVLGRRPGTTSLVVWSDSGEVIAMTVQVGKPSSTKTSSPSPPPNAALRSIATLPSPKPGLTLRECKITDELKNSIAKLIPPTYKSSIQPKTTDVNSKQKQQSADSGYILFIGELYRGGISITLGPKADFEISARSRPVSTQSIVLSKGQSRTYKTKNKIAATTVINSLVAEPIVVSAREIVILGKMAGNATLVVQDDQKNIETIELACVQNDASPPGETSLDLQRPQKPPGNIPIVVDRPMHLCERTTSEIVSLSTFEPRCFNTSNGLVRVAIANEAIAEVLFIESKQIALYGVKPGKTTVFLWDEEGNSTGIHLVVSASNGSNTNDLHVPISISQPNEQHKAMNSVQNDENVALIEYWTGSKKDVLSVPRTQNDK